MTRPVLVVFGTRPEAIKLAPVIHALRAAAEPLPHVVCHTGQHRQLADDVLEIFGIDVDHDLDVMVHDQTLNHVGGSVMRSMDEVLSAVCPSLVLVQGDTTSAAMAALAGFYRKVRVAHVEAGLRTGDKWYPYPEEANRKIITAVADLHFAPTERARHNLLREGIPPASISVPGNTVIDALCWAQERIQRGALGGPVHPDLGADAGGRPLLLVTTHRRENFGEPMLQIARALRRIAAAHEQVDIVFSLHPNPNVRATVVPVVSAEPRIRIVEPPHYLQFVDLMRRSFAILTDSGGIQEEATFLGKPTLVLRRQTERAEAEEAGVTVGVGPDEEAIVTLVNDLLTDEGRYRRMASPALTFGDGHAAERIVATLRERLAPA